MRRLSWLALLWLALPAAARAADVFVIRVLASSRISASSCGNIKWYDNIVFQNSGSVAATIRLLEVSNGGIVVPPPLDLLVPPGKTVNSGGKINWTPASGDPIWVNKIDVPDGVIVKSRVEAFEDGCFGIPPSSVPNLGAFSLPVFRALTPAGTPQIHLGADLGFQSSSLNVGIYNDGAQGATASVEVRQVCDDTVREARTFTIPPKTLLQFGGLGLSGTSCEPSGSEFNSWMRYVTVMVDQPGFSYIVNRSTQIPVVPERPLIPYASP